MTKRLISYHQYTKVYKIHIQKCADSIPTTSHDSNDQEKMRTENQTHILHNNALTPSSLPLTTNPPVPIPIHALTTPPLPPLPLPRKALLGLWHATRRPIQHQRRTPTLTPRHPPRARAPTPRRAQPFSRLRSRARSADERGHAIDGFQPPRRGSKKRGRGASEGVSV